jgi:hypothetical protein
VKTDGTPQPAEDSRKPFVSPGRTTIGLAQDMSLKKLDFGQEPLEEAREQPANTA